MFDKLCCAAPVIFFDLPRCWALQYLYESMQIGVGTLRGVSRLKSQRTAEPEKSSTFTTIGTYQALKYM